MTCFCMNSKCQAAGRCLGAPGGEKEIAWMQEKNRQTFIPNPDRDTVAGRPASTPTGGPQPGPAGIITMDATTVSECGRLISLWWRNWRLSQPNPEHWREVDRFIGFIPEKLMDCVREAPKGEPSPAPAGDDSKRGLYRKYDVRRSDGSSHPGGKHHKCRYYVLDLDRFAPWAMNAYARACEKEYPELAKDLKLYVAGKTFDAVGDVIRSYDLAALVHGPVVPERLMAWTREKPAILDWYWVRVVHTASGKSSSLGPRRVLAREWEYSVEGTHYEFAGPIPEPIESPTPNQESK